MIVRIQASIPWHYTQCDSGRWIAVCDPLGLTVQSERYSEMTEDINDTLDLLFQDLLTDQALDEFLSAKGWTRGSGPLPEPEDAQFDVPFELIASRNDGPAEHLHQ